MMCFKYYLYGFKILSNCSLNLLDEFCDQVYIDTVNFNVNIQNNDFHNNIHIRFYTENDTDYLELSSNISYILDYKNNIIYAQASTMEQIQSTMLNLPFAIFLVRKEMLLLHGSCFCYNKQLIPLCAPKGTGKTTLTAALTKIYPFFSDDTVALLSYNGIVGYAGSNCIKLTDSSYEALGFDIDLNDLPRNIQNKVYMRMQNTLEYRSKSLNLKIVCHYKIFESYCHRNQISHR
mgnify:CR=1 FL=1